MIKSADYEKIGSLAEARSFDERISSVAETLRHVKEHYPKTADILIHCVVDSENVNVDSQYNIAFLFQFLAAKLSSEADLTFIKGRALEDSQALSTALSWIETLSPVTGPIEPITLAKYLDGRRDHYIDKLILPPENREIIGAKTIATLLKEREIDPVLFIDRYSSVVASSVYAIAAINTALNTELLKVDGMPEQVQNYLHSK